MTDIKMIACVLEVSEFTYFFELINRKHNLTMVSDLTRLHALLETDEYDTAVVFIDHVLLNNLSKDLFSLFQKNKYFYVVLDQGHYKSSDHHDRLPFIYDELDCSSIFLIEDFMIKLEKDVTHQLNLQTMKNELCSFYDIGKQLTAEKNIQVLLELIIDTCIELTTSDAGTIYIVIDDDTQEWSTYERNNAKKKLEFVFAKNKSIHINLKSVISPITNTSISGYCVITGKSFCIHDAYQIPTDVEYQFNTKFDEVTGYKTKSILTIPMKDHQNKVMGVIQLINKKATNNHIISYSPQDISVIDALAGMAAVVLENNFLSKKTENLLENYKETIDVEITRRKQADEEINKLLSAVEHSPSTVIITDVNGTIVYVNPKFTELTGYEYKESIGKTPRILKSGKQSEAFYKHFWDTILQGKDWSGEFYNKKKDGSHYWESSKISSLKDENGAITYFISVREDITEKKQIAQKLAEKNEELQETINQLHKAQAQLIQSEKMAGIGQLAAGVAHEINNPIGFAMSNIETLKKYVLRFKELLLNYDKFRSEYPSSTDQEKIQALEAIEEFEDKYHIEMLMDDLGDLFNDTDDGLKRVRDIVSALRSFACIDQLDDFDSYDLNEGIRSTLIMVTTELGEIAFVDVDLGDIPRINAMGNAINQVLLNLLVNAGYAIKDKGAEEKGIISVKTYLKDNCIYCEISDTGVGIDEDVKNHIFEPFFTTKPIGVGTGLGLSLAYDTIAVNHHGEIYVDSELNIGTKFTIKFPVK